MAIDPSKISSEIGQTWRSSPLIVGMQILLVVMMGGLLLDRREQRQQMTPLVTQMLEQIREQSRLLASCNPERKVPSSLNRGDQP